LFDSHIASYIIGVIGFSFAILGKYTLAKSKRKPLLLGCQVAMGVFLAITGILVIFKQEWAAMAAFTVFIAIIQMGSGIIA